LKADLHIHTYFSDSDQSPEKIAALAREKRLDYISVCDHDVITAYPRLIAACAKEGVKLIQGVEIDVHWNKQWLHLLAYDFDPESEIMLRLLSKSKLEIYELNDDLIRNMSVDFPQLSMAEYEIYQYRRERGGFNAINYIYDKGLSENPIDSMKYVNIYNHYTPNFPEMSKTCQIIKAAGGIPILAHPGKWWEDEVGSRSVTAKLMALKTLGLEGVECYHPAHSPAFTQICVVFCEINDMYITCGSDCHGNFFSPSLGIMDIDMENLRLWSGFGTNPL